MKYSIIKKFVNEVLLEEQTNDKFKSEPPINLAISLNGDWYDANYTSEQEEPVGGVTQNETTSYFKVWFKYLGVTKTSRYKNIQDAKTWVLNMICFAIWSDEMSIITRTVGLAAVQRKEKWEGGHGWFWQWNDELPMAMLALNIYDRQKAIVVYRFEKLILTKKAKEHLTLENWLLKVIEIHKKDLDKFVNWDSSQDYDDMGIRRYAGLG